MKKLKVLHCINSLSGGGAERQLNILVNSLQEENVSSEIFCADSSGNMIDETEVCIHVVPNLAVIILASLKI